MTRFSWKFLINQCFLSCQGGVYCVFEKLKQYVCVLLLFAVIISFSACDDNSSSNNIRRSDDIEITDLQMALLCDVVFRDELDTYLANGQELSAEKDRSLIRDDYLNDMVDRNLSAELSGFTVVDFDHGNITGFRAAAFKKSKNIVIAYCGTEDIADVLTDIGSGLIDFSSQDGQAKQFAEDNANRYPDCNIYIAGYSLGGRLAYLGTEAIIDRGYENRLMRVCTFNGLGVTEMINTSDSKLSNVHRLEEKMEDYIVNYIVKGDDVSDGWVKQRLVFLNLSHIGKRVFYDCTTPEDFNLGYVEIAGVRLLNLTKHDLYTFIDALSEHRKTDSPKNERKPLQDFDIVGSWKSVGDSGFGQAQPGAIVTFDELHCNFYSPNDTYSLYQSGEEILLECTSMIFSERLDFNVVIIDDSNIQIKYGSTTTQLKRLDIFLGEESGVDNSGFSIVGSWKSVGDWGFGQAQPGATVTFDGEHCNFYSPYDTYHFYQEEGKWKLSCKNFLWQDVVDFTVEIIDDDNINIYNSSSRVTKLTRSN